MHVVILCSDCGNGVDSRLPSVHLLSGETLFFRQVRLFYRAGVRDITVVITPQQSVDILRAEVQPFSPCRFSFIPSLADFLKDLPDCSDNFLIVQSNLVFSGTLLHRYLESDHDYCALIDKNDGANSFLQAHLGLNTITAIGPELSGIGVFSMLPFYRLKGQGFRALLEALSQRATSFESALSQIMEEFSFYPLNLENDFAALISGPRQQNDSVFIKIRECDQKEQNVVRKRAGILHIAELMEQLEIHAPLLLHDDSYTDLPVQEVLDHFGIHPVFFAVGDCPTKAEFKEAAEVFKNNNLDGIVSVGGNSVIDAAKLVKLYSTEGFSEDVISRPFFSVIPHIAVPTAADDGTARKASACFWNEAKQCFSFSSDLMLPDAAIIDANLQKLPSFIPKKRKKKTRNVQHRGIRFAIIKMLKHFPRMYRWVRNRYYYVLAFFYRYKYVVQDELVLFEAFQGNQYSCNPKAIYERMLEDDAYRSFQYIWALRKPKSFSFLKDNPNTKIVIYGSREHLKAAARAKYLVANAAIPQYIQPGKEQVYIHTWHGKPIKRIGCDVRYKTAGGRGPKENKRVYTRDSRRLSFLLSPSSAFTKHMISAFNLNELHKENIVVETGYPRNDFLFRYTQEDVLRVKMNLKIPLDKRVILYAPTWRPTQYVKGVGYIFNESTIDFEALKSALPSDCVLLFRAHINEARSVDFSEMADFVYDVTKYKDVNELYIISDLMISDYSGTIFDYANLHRPIVLYQYDREEYVNDLTGVYIDLDELPGEVVLRESDLAAAIKYQLDHFEYDEKYRAFNERYNGLDGRDCSERVLRELIPPITLPSKTQEAKKALRQQLTIFKTQLRGFLQASGIRRDVNAKRLATFKNIHQGERCFLIGNGPSLSVQDLESIKNEITFSCNMIYKIFDRTEWRPTYHCITDQVFTKTVINEIKEEIQVPLFTNQNVYNGLKNPPDNMISVYTIGKDPYYVHGNLFSYYVSSRATVMTFMIELAIYMGFKEIYLIGVDCSNGFVGKGSHFIEEYENKDMMAIEHARARRLVKGKHMTLEELGKYRTDRAMYAYSVLRKYSDAHGVHIMNATRGGYLEEFERVSLDDILSKE